MQGMQDELSLKQDAGGASSDTTGLEKKISDLTATLTKYKEKATLAVKKIKVLSGQKEELEKEKQQWERNCQVPVLCPCANRLTQTSLFASGQILEAAASGGTGATEGSAGAAELQSEVGTLQAELQRVNQDSQEKMAALSAAHQQQLEALQASAAAGGGGEASEDGAVETLKSQLETMQAALTATQVGFRTQLVLTLIVLVHTLILLC